MELGALLFGVIGGVLLSYAVFRHQAWFQRGQKVSGVISKD